MLGPLYATHIRNYAALWFSPPSVKSVLSFSLPQRVLQLCWLSKPGNSLRFAHRTRSGKSSCAGGAASGSLVVGFIGYLNFHPCRCFVTRPSKLLGFMGFSKWKSQLTRSMYIPYRRPKLHTNNTMIGRNSIRVLRGVPSGVLVQKHSIMTMNKWELVNNTTANQVHKSRRKFHGDI